MTDPINTRTVIAVIVYATFLLDNILLTVIVPILPDYLMQISNGERVKALPESVVYRNVSLHYITGVLRQANDQATVVKAEANVTTVETYSGVENENAAIGLLLAVKAIVQIVFNPLVGGSTKVLGYTAPITGGTICILVAALVFCVGNSYGMLLLARTIHGVGSACVNVCGMSLVAQLYPEDEKRSKVMGVILGSVALGVLIGYPLGGVFYDFVGITAPFLLIAAVLVANLTAQFRVFDYNVKAEVCHENSSLNWRQLLTDRLILMIVLGIWVSTSAMSILEPCLPVWLIQNLHPKVSELLIFCPYTQKNIFNSIRFLHAFLHVLLYNIHVDVY
jgi:MFS transporter, DHA1 family, solute carrier family 18 (vesicular amine transporter), member 1/2